MQRRVTTLKTDRKAWTPRELLELWHHYLQEQDRSAGTVIKYTQAVTHFLAWYEQEEHAPLTLEALTPIALIGYRNELHHAQHKSPEWVLLPSQVFYCIISEVISTCCLFLAHHTLLLYHRRVRLFPQ